jgi:predicted transcriptional regulator
MALPSPQQQQTSTEDIAFQQAVADGVASLDAGRSVPYEDVRRWLLSWGTDSELPPPQCP